METFHQMFGTNPETITWWQMSARAAVVMVYAVILLRLGARRVLGNDTAMDIIVAVPATAAPARCRSQLPGDTKPRPGHLAPAARAFERLTSAAFHAILAQGSGRQKKRRKPRPSSL